MYINSYSKFLEDLKDIKLDKQSIGSEHKSLKKINIIINALEAYKGNYNKKFNFEKLIESLSIPISEREDVLEIILKFQHLFQSTLRNHKLIPYKINNSLYFITENYKDGQVIIREEENIRKKKEIILDQKDLNNLNNMIYIFKHVNRGKAFNLEKKNSDLIKNIKRFLKIYPDLFCTSEINQIYPSKLGIELGEIINSYFKCNRIFEDIVIENYKIRVQ